MRKTNIHEENEQITAVLDNGFIASELEPVEGPIEPKKKPKVKELKVGTAVTVNPEVKRFCDGRGIPDYARKAYIKRFNLNNQTVLIESEPNGKEYGLLFIRDVTLL